MAKVAQIFLFIVLGYLLYTIFPFGRFMSYAETGNGPVAAVSASDAAQKTPEATVVELFTSQGCYSCPPAEAYLRDLSQREDIIALEFHVDYWDDLVYGLAGKWKDPFSSPEATMRQSDYNIALRGKPNAYTPQMVIDGRFETVGSRRSAVDKAISRAQSDRGDRLRLNPVLSPEGVLNVSVGGVVEAPDVELIYVRLLKRKVTEVKSGENKGKTLASYNVVRDWKKIGAIDPERTEYSKQVKTLDAGETCAVIAQQRKTRRIYGGAFCQM